MNGYKTKKVISEEIGPQSSYALTMELIFNDSVAISEKCPPLRYRFHSKLDVISNLSYVYIYSVVGLLTEM